MHHCSTLVTVGTPGCTNPKANNYNPNAKADDKSCDFTNTDGYVKILTKSAYKEGKINGQVQYAGKQHFIKTKISLKEKNSIIRTKEVDIDQYGRFETTVDQAISAGQYTLEIEAQHLHGGYDKKQYILKLEDTQ